MKSTRLDFSKQRFLIGIDVHRDNWSVTIRTETMALKTFSMNPSPEELVGYMKRNYPGGRYFSVYEAGYCGYWIHRDLERLGVTNIVVNPADVPTTNKEKDRKDDPIDSRKLSRELSNGSLRGIYVPDPYRESLRVLSRALRQYTVRSTQVKNRIKALLRFLGTDPGLDEEKYWSAASIKKLSAIALAYPASTFVLRSHLDELNHTRQQRLAILRRIRAEAKSLPDLSLIRTVPGIGLITGFTLYTELIDIERFATLDQLASMVGLVPSTASSNKKVSVRGVTQRQNVFLRSLLIEASWVAVRKDPALTKSYSDLCQRMPKTKAIVHVAKKLLNRVRCVWKRREPYALGVVDVRRGNEKKQSAATKLQPEKKTTTASLKGS